MTNDNIVPMPNAMQVAPVIIDDSRLQTLWGQQHRRQNWIVWGCCATALLIASALVVMAFRINSEPPKVEVAAPVINIPEQPAPVVNITNPPPTINVRTPAAPAPTVTPPPSMTPRTGESKVVTEYTQFTTVTVGQFEVHSGGRTGARKTAPRPRSTAIPLIGRTGKRQPCGGRRNLADPRHRRTERRHRSGTGGDPGQELPVVHRRTAGPDPVRRAQQRQLYAILCNWLIWGSTKWLASKLGAKWVKEIDYL